MSTRTTRSSLKRGIDADDKMPSPKRSKSNTKKSTSKPKTTTTNENDPSPSCNEDNAPIAKPQDSDEKEEPITSPPKTLTLPESTGDIFAAPPNTLLIHACNTEGSWGAGIAKAFKDHYPSAYQIYNAHCRKHGAKLHATALLIPPSETKGPKHFVGCLFTSRSKGKKRDSPKQILEATGPAMRDLLRRVEECNAERDGEGESVGEVWMCKINSGLFGVNWEDTRAVLEGIEVEGGKVGEVKVVSREE
ncbi:hypothetical protein PRZ48_014511 [Zasmidium cellare]|uniref:ADP-ribose 1''-phosphate phosphatase n=1 Tax=Zasmidium cellare TaxID=395010 RepID=A0ABR0DYZ3_ZASCE|nr:hypothetical protein PRZ48_014511 [Zasmidium cellare]